jgi:hypothetical protein
MKGSEPVRDDSVVARELDAAHELAHDAYARLDAVASMAIFHPELDYVRPDGSKVDRAQLARDVRSQLARVHAAESDYRRLTLELHGADEATELLEQRARFEVRAFRFVRREWSVRRRGRYQWRKTSNGWQIRRVDLLSEEISSRTWLAFR